MSGSSPTLSSSAATAAAVEDPPPSPIPHRLSMLGDDGHISVSCPVHSASSLGTAPPPAAPSPGQPDTTQCPPPPPTTATTTAADQHQPQQAPPPQPYDNTPLKKLLVLAFLATSAVSAVLPAIGPILEDDIFDGDGNKASLFLSLVSLSSSAIEFFSNPLLGAASDQYGRRPFTLLALVGSLVSFVAIGAFPSRAAFIVSGVLRGLTSVTGAMFYSMVVDLSKSVKDDPAHITKNTGLMIACGAVGLVFGAAVGAALTAIGNRYAFLGAAVIELVVIGYFALFVKESLAVSTPFKWRDHNPFTALGILCQSRSLSLLSVVFVLQALTWGVYVQAPFFTEERFDWKGPNIGAVLVWGGIIMVCTQAVGVRFLTPRYGEYRLLVIAFTAGILHFGLMGLATAGWMWFAVIAVTFPWFLAAPALRGLMAKSVSGLSQGRLQGGVSALSTLSVSTAPLLASLIYGYGIDESKGEAGQGEFDPVAGLVFYYGSGLCLVGLVASFVLLRKLAGARPGNRAPTARREPLHIITEDIGGGGGGGASAAATPTTPSAAAVGSGSGGGASTGIELPSTPVEAITDKAPLVPPAASAVDDADSQTRSSASPAPQRASTPSSDSPPVDGALQHQKHPSTGSAAGAAPASNPLLRASGSRSAMDGSAGGGASPSQPPPPASSDLELTSP